MRVLAFNRNPRKTATQSTAQCLRSGDPTPLKVKVEFDIDKR